MSTSAAPSPEHVVAEPPVSNGRLAFALIAPPAAWALHELVCTVVSVVVCEAGNVGAARATVIVVSLVALGFTIAGGVLGWASWRRFAPEDSIASAEAKGAREMLAFVGLLLGIVFTLAVVWAGLSALVVGDICGAKR